MSVIIKDSNSIRKGVSSVDFGLLEESIAYETLLALQGATEVKLKNEFLSKEKFNVLASEILEEKKEMLKRKK